MRDLNTIEINSTTGGESILEVSPQDAFKWASAGIGMYMGWGEGAKLWSWSPMENGPDIGSYAAGIAGGWVGALVGGFVGKTTATVLLPKVA